jgi:predicted ABC-type transport system involved in lysophospholipase L1 biosynthesis ATPase subunit
MGQEPVLAFRDVRRAFRTPGGADRPVLEGVTAEIAAGESVAVVGRSGSGKSTLLHLAAGIDEPDGGEVRLAGRPLAALSDRERSLARRDLVGVVFQFFHLLGHLTVLENVLLPALVAGDEPARAAARARDLLARAGLGGREADAVARLSGGEMQRVALCRALQRAPRLLLADEPTGNLDDASAEPVLDLLFGLARQEGSAVLVVTHGAEVAARADRTWRLHGGRLEPA